MKINRPRIAINCLSFLSLICALTVKKQIISYLMMIICLISAVIILYRKLPQLSDISEDNPKIKTLRLTTIFNIAIVILCTVFTVMSHFGILKFNDDGRFFACLIITCVILFGGNISPKLPFNRHTGLRLPWTVTDEDTWIIAHRILGYISIPIALIYISCALIADRFEILTAAVVALWVGIPAVLSYIYNYKKFHGIL